MAELDELLSEELKRIAPPAESSGVADAIRARVEAGDAGFAAAASTAPGWGGGAAGWLPWIGVVVVAGLVGGGVGWSGIAGAATEATLVAGSTSVLDAVVDAGSCPGGPVVRTLSADTRVLAVARSDDSAYLGVRNPDDVATTIWVPASVVVADDATGLAELPVGDACPKVVITVPKPVVVAPVEPEAETPSKPGSPPPAGDTTAPTVTQLTVNKPWAYLGDSINLVAAATDNVAVAAVDITWSGAHSGSGSMTFSAGQWKFTLIRPAAPVGNVTFTARARDAAGNVSAPTSVNVYFDIVG